MQFYKFLLFGVVGILLGLGLGRNNLLGDFFDVQQNLFYEPTSTVEKRAQLEKVKLSSLSSSSLEASYALQNAFNRIAENSIKAVVSIQVSAKTDSSLNSNTDHNDFFRRFFGLPENYGQSRKVELFGSGFLINENGYLLSNYHVVKNAIEIKILFNNSKKEYNAEVVGTDPDTDIALLKIKEKEKFPFLILANSDQIKVGDLAIAIGNPFGLSQTFTTGVISAKGRTGIIGNKYENWIQTDVAINEGNSGGPLINLAGEVIGINSAIFSKGGGSIGISFSIPINMAKDIVEQLKVKGRVERGWIGIRYQEIDDELAEAMELGENGVIINQILDDSPASKADLKAGDVLISYRGKTIRSGNDLIRELAKTPLGEKVDLIIIRNGKKITTQVTIEKRVVDSNGIVSPMSSTSYLGITASSLTEDQRRSLGLDHSYGIIVIGLEYESSFAKKGGRKGDVILSINKKRMKSIKDFEAVMKKIKKGQKLLFKIQRNKTVDYLVISV